MVLRVALAMAVILFTAVVGETQDAPAQKVDV